MKPLVRGEIWENGDPEPYIGRHGHPLYLPEREELERLIERALEISKPGQILRVSPDICGTLIDQVRVARAFQCDPELPPNSMVADVPMYLWSDE